MGAPARQEPGVSVSWVVRAALKAERMAVEQAAIATEQAAE